MMTMFAPIIASFLVFVGAAFLAFKKFIACEWVNNDEIFCTRSELDLSNAEAASEMGSEAQNDKSESKEIMSKPVENSTFGIDNESSFSRFSSNFGDVGVTDEEEFSVYSATEEI